GIRGVRHRVQCELVAQDVANLLRTADIPDRPGVPEFEIDPLTLEFRPNGRFTDPIPGITRAAQLAGARERYLDAGDPCGVGPTLDAALGRPMTTVIDPGGGMGSRCVPGPFYDLCVASEAQCGPFGSNPVCEANFQRGISQLAGVRPMGFLDDLGINTFLPTMIPNGTGSVPGPTQPDSFFGTLLGSAVPLLQALANAGVIRGSVGQALAPMAAMSQNQMVPSAVGMAPAGVLPLSPARGRTSLTHPLALPSPSTIMAGGAMAIEAGQLISSLFGSSGSSCGGARPVVMAPTLFRTNACGKSSLPARTQVMGPDGAIYVVANLGRATRGS